MSALASAKVSVEQYLAFEDPSGVQYEYHGGEMFPIAELSYAHSAIAANAIGLLRGPLIERSCAVLSQAHTRIAAADYVVPDISVVCGGPVLARDGRLTNPKVVFEVLSPSTENYDSGGKRRLYCGLSSLAEYVLVSQDAPLVEVFRKAAGFWQVYSFAGLDAMLKLESLDIAIPLAELYRGIEFPHRPIAFSGLL